MTLRWTVTISGGGLAAACCDHLLRGQGVAVRWKVSARPQVPAIMLSDAARALVRDCLAKPGLFADNARINRRIVAWGGGEPVCMPHRAVMLRAGDLDFTPESSTSPSPSPSPSAATTGSFAIRTGREAADQIVRFGERVGEAASVRLLVPDDADACWIEAVEQGWLFMIPASEPSGWLLAVGAPCDVLLGQSRHLARRVVVEGRPARFDTTPRMLQAMGGDRWLACGSEAMAFDPICGDGTALAVRQAILASAVAGAVRDGADGGPLLDHYQAMMVAAMRRHLRLSAHFYETGGTSPWWRAQQQALAAGFADCSAWLERQPPPRFAIEGFRLVPRALAA